MSTMEQEPPKPTPVISMDRIETGYFDYFSGLIKDDSELLLPGAHILDEARVPLALELRYYAQWRGHCLPPESSPPVTPEEITRRRPQTQRHAILSFVYSAMPFDPNELWAVTVQFGKDGSWLKNVLYPTDPTLEDRLRLEDETEKKRARQLGFDTLRALGMMTWFDRAEARLQALLKRTELGK